MQELIQRLRALCLALPGTTERASHGTPCFFVGTTVKSAKMFVMVDDHHHGVEHVGFWCAAPPGVQDELIAEAPERFFRPPYVGHRGWLGVRIDVPDTDWAEVQEIVRDAHGCIAPASLAARPGRRPGH